MRWCVMSRGHKFTILHILLVNACGTQPLLQSDLYPGCANMYVRNEVSLLFSCFRDLSSLIDHHELLCAQILLALERVERDEDLTYEVYIKPFGNLILSSFLLQCLSLTNSVSTIFPNPSKFCASSSFVFFFLHPTNAPD